MTSGIVQDDPGYKAVEAARCGGRRATLEETWQYLEAFYDAPRDEQGEPFVPKSMPRHDDEELGFSWFREGLEEADFSHLTIPRTFFGRSLLERIDFQNSDLTESRMCWNNWNNCNFSGVDLTRCKLRASCFSQCDFKNAVLTNADLRLSSFAECNFVGADMQGAKPTRSQIAQVKLTEEQIAAIHWKKSSGTYPAGG